MLVGNVESIKASEEVISSRVRFHRADCLDDLFAGELYFPLRYSSFKALRLGSERKLNASALLSGREVRRDGRPNGMVEGASEVVSRVADDCGEQVWDGGVGFDAQGTLTDLSIRLHDKAVAALGEEGLDLPIQVVDVMFGPLDL